MTASIAFALIAAGTFLSFISLLSIFGASGSSTSSFDLWIAARKEIKLAQLKLKQTEAEHALKCPRLTDTPRTRT